MMSKPVLAHPRKVDGSSLRDARTVLVPDHRKAVLRENLQGHRPPASCPVSQQVPQRDTIARSFAHRFASLTSAAGIAARVQQRFSARAKLLAGMIPAFAGSCSFTSDHALAAAGLAAAVGSASFAGYMIIQAGQGPGAAASSRAVIAAPPHDAGLRQPKSLPSAYEALDLDATGTILPGPAGGANREAREPAKPEHEQALKGYSLRFADEGTALIQGPGGIYAVVPGVRVPDAGMILSVEKRSGRWIVVSEKGFIEGPRF